MDLFKQIITEVSEYLKKLGFTKRGTTFYRVRSSNYEMLGFQKSKSSSKSALSFTINFGVYSKILGQIFGFLNEEQRPPEIEACQWHARIGAFMPGNPDFWWDVHSDDGFEQCVEAVIDSIKTTVIPELNKRVTDQGLIEHWMLGGYAGTTAIGRFKYLTTLLHKAGDERLNKVVEQFMALSKGKPDEYKAKMHLQELGLRVNDDL